jgi:hypothetical protein
MKGSFAKCLTKNLNSFWVDENIDDGQFRHLSNQELEQFLVDKSFDEGQFCQMSNQELEQFWWTNTSMLKLSNKT